MGTNILSLKEEQSVLTDFYEELNILLQDSDAIKEKEKIKEAIKNMSSTTTYLIMGDGGVGKTELLKYMFRDVADIPAMTANICEYRYGEANAELPAVEGYEKKFIVADNLMGISLIDTKGINTMSMDEKQKLAKMLERCSAVLVTFSAEDVNSLNVWDIIEDCPEKKMLFFVTKCDLVSKEVLDKNMSRLKAYMHDSKITAPLFPVSIKEDGKVSDVVELEDVKLYIRDNVVGKNPILSKQRENVNQLKKLLVRVQSSMQERKAQYLSDEKILSKINASLDAYVANQQGIIDSLNKNLSHAIGEDIDRYQSEIISKLDPYKIKKRFSSKEDFEAYLNMVNENYKSMMNESVNAKTVETMKNCLHDLEIVFKEAIGYFNQRENILKMNDEFYGSLSKSRKEIVVSTKDEVMVTGEYYKTLSDASEELFLKIWGEREKFDNWKKQRRVVSSTAGALAGGVGAAVALKTSLLGMGAALAQAQTTAAVLAALAPAALVVVGVIVGAVVLNRLAKVIFDPKMANKMEEACQKAIEEFKTEVANTKRAMIEQITGQVKALFEKELNSIDGYFTDFRISVNVDGEKIPKLEKSMEKVSRMIEVIDNLEKQEA
ncbi:MAG: GTPase domain-containing protein [Butyrivibrio sp.]|nr:GTPase domain-containing protein [Butyrivibrio sp.]